MAQDLSAPPQSAARAGANGTERYIPVATRVASAGTSLLFADDIAALVGMTKDWVYAETRAGRIPHLTLGRYYRYRPESIDAWLCEVEQGAVNSQRNGANHR